MGKLVKKEEKTMGILPICPFNELKVTKFEDTKGKLDHIVLQRQVWSEHSQERQLSSKVMMYSNQMVNMLEMLFYALDEEQQQEFLKRINE